MNQRFYSLLFAGVLFAAPAQSRWWKDEPVRFLQTNLPETYSTLDSDRLIRQVAEYPANTLLFNMGGIVAQYPTGVEFHYASPHLPPGRDLFGEIVEKAHQRGIRVVGRFDLSKTQKPVFDAHPEWFFRRANGEPVIYNGLYSACINGGYYREHARIILTEALERYPVDGLFFNMFGNPSSDYSGRPMGPCQCDGCKTKFQARYPDRSGLPTSSNDDDYHEFMNTSSREVAAMIADLIHRLRPNAAFLTYIEDYTDVIMHESNTSMTRALPMWPYSASDNVDRSRHAQPDKAVFNLCMSFVDYPWRFVTVPQPEIQLRLWQNLAHGGPPALVVVGTLDQEDRQSLIAGQPIFRWHAKHEDLYVGQESAARVLLLPGRTESYRGFFRLLSERHIPFAATTNLRLLEDPARQFDLVIAPSGILPEWSNVLRGSPQATSKARGRSPSPPSDGGEGRGEEARSVIASNAPLLVPLPALASRGEEATGRSALERYVRNGGRLLIAGASPPPAEFPLGKVVGRKPHTQGSWRIHDHALLPSLKDTGLLFLDGEYVEFAPLDKPLLTLIPPAMFGPPEKVWVDKVETEIPGLLFAGHGKGRVACIPWDVGGHYYRQSSQGHAGLMTDVIDRLLPRGRQLKCSAHPLVEITVMKQSKHNRTLLHFVNGSGHSDTAYFTPIEMRDIAVELAEEFGQVRAMVAGKSLPVKRAGAYGRFTLQKLGVYEVVVLGKR